VRAGGDWLLVIGHPIFHADQQQTDKQEESLSALALLFFAAFVTLL
jgi:hypothetical protein